LYHYLQWWCIVNNDALKLPMKIYEIRNLHTILQAITLATPKMYVPILCIHTLAPYLTVTV